MAFTPFQPDAETHIQRGKLPHWRQWGATYFVTARLADSVPTGVAADWRHRRDVWLSAHGIRTADEIPQLTDAQRHEYHREFTAKFHELLDAGHGECLLARPSSAELLRARLTAGHATAYHLDAWCIMPNHFHALVEPAAKVPLGEIVRHWKGGSAADINRALGRKGGLWQKESFDHIVRSEEQLAHFRRYIADNPKKAGLSEGYLLGSGAEQM